MDTREIISAMSDDDALLALQAARAYDIEGSKAAMEAMSREGLDAFISVLEESVRRKDAHISKAAGTIVDAENG